MRVLSQDIAYGAALSFVTSDLENKGLERLGKLLNWTSLFKSQIFSSTVLDGKDFAQFSIAVSLLSPTLVSTV